jgi:hypothetical protein
MEKFIDLIILNRGDIFHNNNCFYTNIVRRNLYRMFILCTDKCHVPPQIALQFIHRISIMKYKYITKNNLIKLWKNIEFITALSTEMKESGVFNHVLYDKNLLKNIIQYGPLNI